MPAEIGFLVNSGFPAEMLHHAAVFAEMGGVSPDDFLLKNNLIDEVAFYRALAQELGAPFTLSPRLSVHCRYPESILADLAPLRQAGSVAIAPRGATLQRLLANRRAAPGSLVITPPSRLARAVMCMQGNAVARHGAMALPHKDSSLSILNGLEAVQIGAMSFLSLVLSAGSVEASGLTMALLATVLTPVFFIAAVLRLAAALQFHPVTPRFRPQRIEDGALPIYTIIVPLYRERRIASRLVAALSRLDYPAAKLDIKFVIEADDRETAAALAAIDMPGFIDIIVAPPGEPRTKPRALNIALPLARGLYTVIYDAEDVPEPAQLRDAVAFFTRQPSHVACLQARLTIDNTDDTWLTKLFTIEYATLFDVFNPGLMEMQSPIMLGGTSNHFRTKVLQDICGWDAWNVTEDADLGLRLARLGYDVADLPSSTLEEAPGTLDQWLGQRTRWMKGFMQTCVTHSRNPWTTLQQLGPWRFSCALALSLGTVLSALCYPFFTLYFILAWQQGWLSLSGTIWQALWHVGSATMFCMGLAAIFLPAWVSLQRRGLWRLLPWTLLLPAYYALVSVAAWRALWEVMRTPFRWNKTSHGLARTSRSGLLQKHQARAAETTSVKTAGP